MSGMDIDPQEDWPGGELPDGVPPRVRTVVYLVGLIVGALATAAIGITTAVFPDHVTVVAAVAGAIDGVVLTIAGGLGVAYRPTR